MSAKFWEVYWEGAMELRLRRLNAVNRIVRGDIEKAALGTTSPTFNSAQAVSKRIETLRMAWTGGMENVYRVRVDPNSGQVEVACLGIDRVDRNVEGTYPSAEDLPQWVRRKLAVLNMVRVEPPQEKIEGVGMRVDRDVFWVLQGED